MSRVSRLKQSFTIKATDAPAGQGATTTAYSRRTPRRSNAALRDTAAPDCKDMLETGH